MTNAIPRQLLINKTKGKRLVECSKHSTWGCGMAIHNEKCLDTSLWTSQGIMGELLEEIRGELSGPEATVLPPLPNFAKFGSEDPQNISRQTQPNADPTASMVPAYSYPKPTAVPIEGQENRNIDTADDTSTASSSSEEDNSDT